VRQPPSVSGREYCRSQMSRITRQNSPMARAKLKQGAAGHRQEQPPAASPHGKVVRRWRPGGPMPLRSCSMLSSRAAQSLPQRDRSRQSARIMPGRENNIPPQVVCSASFPAPSSAHINIHQHDPVTSVGMRAAGLSRHQSCLPRNLLADHDVSCERAHDGIDPCHDARRPAGSATAP